jgi:uncharacterized membrane protein YeaQ/YmgE (transglycosylase-associated protein family)
MNPPKLVPALLGGTFIGVLSALPLVNVANCCCLWLLAGGVLAAYVMQQNHPAPIRAADGAIVGLLAGIVGAFVYVLVSLPLNAVMAPLVEALRSRMLQEAQDMPADVREAIDRFGSGSASVAIGFVMNLFLGMVFSTLGGLLGAALFKKPSLPPAPPPPSPGAWSPPSAWPPPPPAPPSMGPGAS